MPRAPASPGSTAASGASSAALISTSTLPAAAQIVQHREPRDGAAAVVGAVVGEISTGVQGGIGRLLISYSQEATSDPAKVYTAMLGAAVLGLVVAGLIALLELPLMRHRRRVEVATL